jgi:hypothetical protein
MSKRASKSLVLAALGVVFGCLGTSVQALPVPLSSLIPGGSLTCGDKVFTNFGYSATGDMPLATAVNVDCTLLSGNDGLLFQGAFTDSATPGNSDALILYTVTSTGGLIIDAEMTGNPSVVNGDGSIIVTETFTPGSPPTLNIFDIVAGGVHSTSTFDHLNFTPGFVTTNVTKDILASNAGGTPTLSSIQQTYSQAPEPGTLALLGAALVSLVGYGRRRRG